MYFIVFGIKYSVSIELLLLQMFSQDIRNWKDMENLLCLLIWSGPTLFIVSPIYNNGFICIRNMFICVYDFPNDLPGYYIRSQ